MSLRPDCAQVADAIEAYLDDRLAPSAEAAVRAHLAFCDACRSRAAARDPLAHFAVLSEETPDAATTAGFWDAVRAGCESGTTGAPRAAWRPPVRPMRWITPAALAASLVLMTSAVLLAPRAPAPARSTVPAFDAGIGPRNASYPVPETVEEVRTPDARPVQVVTMTWLADERAEASKAGQVTELVLIVDAGLELR